MGEPAHAAVKLAVQFKETRRLWMRDLLAAAGATDPDGLSTQIALLMEGAIAAALVRGDPKVALAAKQAARVLLTADGLEIT